MNLFETEVNSNNEVKINDTVIKISTDLSTIKQKKLKLGIRSEFIEIAKDQKENLITATVEKVEDLGNYKLLTAKIGQLVIKSKIKREIEVSSEKVELHIPHDKCCIYENERLI
jgi:glycerol transport system ATP-binding protein